MNYLQEIKKWIAEITEIGLLLVALGIVAGILFGQPESGKMTFFTGIVTNLTALLNQLGENGLVGLIALGVIVYLFHKRKTVASQ